MSKKIAVFVDYDNQQLDVFALIELLREKGRVVIRRAYADWVSRQSYRKSVVQAGFELIDCPKISATHKNAADIRLAVDCLSISYEYEDIDIYVFVTGDVDFVPLINKLRTMGKETVVVASDPSAAELLQQACDEYIPDHRLDEIETISKGQLTFEESLHLLQKACDQVKSKGFDRDAQDVKSMVKQKMMQLNPSFDEKDYEDCTSFTSYLDKASLFIKLDDMLGGKSGTKSIQTDGKDLQQFPDTLMIKVYNEALRRWGAPVTIQKFEKMLYDIHQDFSMKLYGVNNIKQLISSFQEQGLLNIDANRITIKPDVRFKLTLQQLKFYHKPEIRKIVISKIISLAKNWDVEKRDLTLNGLKKSISDDSEGIIPRADFDGIINILKRGGVFLSPDNVPIFSLNIPLHLLSYELDQIEAVVLSVSIDRLINLSNLENNEKELASLAGLLLGSESKNKIDEIEKHLKKLEKEKKITRKGNYWTKYRK